LVKRQSILEGEGAIERVLEISALDIHEQEEQIAEQCDADKVDDAREDDLSLEFDVK